MKVLLTDYVSSLKERGELDAILPDLLSELGFHIISRPAIGATQRGVDIAAAGKDEDGIRKLFLFSVKAGDLTRSDWNSGAQSMRPSLDEILDDYIPNRIPPQYKRLKIVICLVVGGVVQQTTQPLVTAYIKRYSKRHISFQEWNGDRIAEMLLAGPLREKLLPKALQSSFQKSVAMIDHPDVSYEHFARLVRALTGRASSDKARVRSARQIYICMWVLFVWGRDVDNLDAPYRASELTLLHVWELVKRFINKRGANARAVALVFHHLVYLHIIIAQLFLSRKILPYVGRRHALSLAVDSCEPTDVNLKMFDVLGRMALTGQWMIWLGRRGGGELTDSQISGFRKLAAQGFQLIESNPALFLPLVDEQAIEVCLFLLLSSQVGQYVENIKGWLDEMIRRLSLAVNSHGRYPTVFRDYAELIEHPRARTEEYREDATAGSVLIPLLLAWSTALDDKNSVKALVGLTRGPLKHCTLQLWLPDETSEAHLYVNDAPHGSALADLPATGDGQDLLKILSAASEAASDFQHLSACRCGYYPLILTACRHYRLPVPHPFWISLLMGTGE